MAVLIYKHSPGGVRTSRPARTTASGQPLRLMASGDGWSLLDPDGHLVFDALGTRGRQRCIEFARAESAVVLCS